MEPAFVPGPRMLTREQVPPGLREIHDPTFESVKEARQALGNLAPSLEAIRGETPWPRQPSTLLRTPRQVAAWSYCILAKARGAQTQAPETPAATPAASIDPSGVRDFAHLISFGIDRMTRFLAEHPADYARLKERRDQGNDPQGLRHTGRASY